MEERDEVRREGMNHIIPHKARSSGFILSAKYWRDLSREKRQKLICFFKRPP